MSELKPCPFCGNEVEVEKEHKGGGYFCTEKKIELRREWP